MNELYHHGIKGQKWGVRRYQNPDGTLTAAGKKRYNENYTGEQRLRDRMVYGKGGVKRINKTMNEYGVGVQGARSLEANRINSARRTANVAGNIGKTTGAVAGAVSGWVGYRTVKALMKNSSNPTMQAIGYGLDNNFFADITLSSLVTNGTTRTGALLGQYGGQSMAMIAKGYSPSKYRD